MSLLYLCYIQISNSVSQLVTPIMSNGEQCYLVSTRYSSLSITSKLRESSHGFGVCCCSINDMFPPVSLNFAGGASMMLRPQDYLFHYGFYVSSSTSSTETFCFYM